MILAVLDDLMFSSKIKTAATQLGPGRRGTGGGPSRAVGFFSV